jgi:hypothetical protein
MIAVCAILSMMSAPGMTAIFGKWPKKKISLPVTFLIATTLLPVSRESTRSTIRKGNFWGTSALISSNEICIHASDVLDGAA